MRQGSPWVMKVELAMRCLEIDYDLNQVDMMQVWMKAPEGKVPWLVIERVVDSQVERKSWSDVLHLMFTDHLGDAWRGVHLADKRTRALSCFPAISSPEYSELTQQQFGGNISSLRLE